MFSKIKFSKLFYHTCFKITEKLSILKIMSNKNEGALFFRTLVTEMRYEVVRDIEAGCADLLETFGYKPVGSELDYANKTRSYLPDLLNE